MLLLLAVFVLNFGISWWNAYAVGWGWIEAKRAGGWMRLLSWSAAIMSACGFTWCYLVVIAIGGQAAGYLDSEVAASVFKLGYVIIILPILGSGIAIWADSVAQAWRERSLANIGVAGWNTFAQVYNTYEAIKVVPEFVSDLADTFGEGDSDDNKAGVARLIVLLAVLAVMGGVVTTATIIRLSARKSARQFLQDSQLVGAAS